MWAELFRAAGWRWAVIGISSVLAPQFFHFTGKQLAGPWALGVSGWSPTQPERGDNPEPMQVCRPPLVDQDIWRILSTYMQCLSPQVLVRGQTGGGEVAKVAACPKLSGFKLVRCQVSPKYLRAPAALNLPEPQTWASRNPQSVNSWHFERAREHQSIASLQRPAAAITPPQLILRYSLSLSLSLSHRQAGPPKPCIFYQHQPCCCRPACCKLC